MAFDWNRRFSHLAVGLLLVGLAGCAPMVIESNPDTFEVPSTAASKLRGQQSIVLNNAYKVETQVTILLGVPDWVADLKQYTDTAITLLGGAMTKAGVTVGPATKSVTLRVHSVQAGRGPFTIRSALVLEAEYGDGTKSLINAQNNSPANAWRAIDGAIMRAVSQLLTDERFVAFVNK